MFQRGKAYTRGQIAAALGIKDGSEEQRAVLVVKGKAAAIVINARGSHPSGMKYFNELDETTFTMQGEYDGRGALIEIPGREYPLFFSHGTDGNYTFEGHVVHVATEDLGLPLRRYRRVKMPTGNERRERR